LTGSVGHLNPSILASSLNGFEVVAVLFTLVWLLPFTDPVVVAVDWFAI
jgi:hypothetical protein